MHSDLMVDNMGSISAPHNGMGRGYHSVHTPGARNLLSEWDWGYRVARHVAQEISTARHAPPSPKRGRPTQHEFQEAVTPNMDELTKENSPLEHPFAATHPSHIPYEERAGLPESAIVGDLSVCSLFFCLSLALCSCCVYVVFVVFVALCAFYTFFLSLSFFVHSQLQNLSVFLFKPAVKIFFRAIFFAFSPKNIFAFSPNFFAFSPIIFAIRQNYFRVFAGFFFCVCFRHVPPKNLLF